MKSVNSNINYFTRLSLQAKTGICDWFYFTSLNNQDPGQNIWNRCFQTLHARLWTLISERRESIEVSPQTVQDPSAESQILGITMILWSWRNWKCRKIKVAWICRTNLSESWKPFWEIWNNSLWIILGGQNYLDTSNR